MDMHQKDTTAFTALLSFLLNDFIYDLAWKLHKETFGMNKLFCHFL